MVALKNRVFEERVSACTRAQDASLCSIEPWDMQSSGIDAGQASARRVLDAIERGVRSKRIPFLCSDSLSALRNLGLVRGGMLTNAAALIFCPSAAPLIVCRVYDSPCCDVLLESLDCYGPLEDAFDAAFAFLRRFAPTAFPAFGFDGSKAPFALPVVFEGCLSNALVHRDYRVFSPVQVVVCPGAIEVSSPGIFPENTFVAGLHDRPSDPSYYAECALEAQMVTRNALLLQALYRFGFIEAQGTGMMRVVYASALCGLEVAWSNRGACAHAAITERLRSHCS